MRKRAGRDDESRDPSVWGINFEGISIPGDSDQPEPNAFDVEPVDGSSLAPPIKGSMSSPTREAAQNREATQNRRR